MYLPLKIKIDELLAKAKAEGLDVAMYCATRSFDEQARLYAKGRTTAGQIVTNAPPGFSFHQYGMAADLVFLINGEWSWAENLPWDRLGELGLSVGLEWGGFWDSVDRPHFQLTYGLPISNAFKEYNKNHNIEDVWALAEARNAA